MFDLEIKNHLIFHGLTKPPLKKNSKLETMNYHNCNEQNRTCIADYAVWALLIVEGRTVSYN